MGDDVKAIAGDVRVMVGAIGDDRRMQRQHLNDERPDDLPIAAALWDETQMYSSASNETAAAIYRAIKKLEAEIIALRAGR
ncbi:hypothetical protein ACDT10_21870 [Mycobacterium intracellulare]|uniref:hypothetical protein n=1 Tax=Mycobacterium intracellulare TaxID=1767 RepID=UPI003558D453